MSFAMCSFIMASYPVYQTQVIDYPQNAIFSFIFLVEMVAYICMPSVSMQ